MVSTTTVPSWQGIARTAGENAGRHAARGIIRSRYTRITLSRSTSATKRPPGVPRSRSCARPRRRPAAPPAHRPGAERRRVGRRSTSRPQPQARWRAADGPPPDLMRPPGDRIVPRSAGAAHPVRPSQSSPRGVAMHAHRAQRRRIEPWRRVHLPRRAINRCGVARRYSRSGLTPSAANICAAAVAPRVSSTSSRALERCERHHQRRAGPGSVP